MLEEPANTTTRSALGTRVWLAILVRQHLEQTINTGITNLIGKVTLVGSDQTHATNLDIKHLPPRWRFFHVVVECQSLRPALLDFGAHGYFGIF